MNVSDLMMKDAGVCYPHSTLNEAVRIMWERDCGFVPVVESLHGARVVGVITDRDACMAAYTRGMSLRDLRVADAMSSTVRTCAPTDSISDAESRLAEAQIRRLPVVDEHGLLVGVLSLSDLAREAARERTRGKPAITQAEVGTLVATISSPRQLAASSPR